MKWTRDKATGAYLSGPYVVHETWAPKGETNWEFSGPGLFGNERLLAAAKARVLVACHDRLRDGGGGTCEVVVGDVVRVDDGRRGVITTLLDQPDNARLYCVRLPYKKRLCLFRGEFEVVVP